MGELLGLDGKRILKHISLAIGNPSVEYIRLEEGGAVYIRGEKVDDNHEVYREFLDWLDAARGETARFKHANDQFENALKGEV